jgi:hypothetical protein
MREAINTDAASSTSRRDKRELEIIANGIRNMHQALDGGKT